MTSTPSAKASSHAGDLAAETRLWGLVPAAGVGTRMGAAQPKQFLTLCDTTLLELSVAALIADARLNNVTVVVAEKDTQSGAILANLALRSKRLDIAPCGGSTRAESVRNGLDHLVALGAQPQDWVLVHDAARPGLTAAALARLIDAVLAEQTGGLLALPVVDTVKKALHTSTVDSGSAVQTTVAREHLWLAQTPQMFRLGQLRDALQRFKNVTDESSAIEQAGIASILIEGERRNLKVTQPEDLLWLQTFFTSSNNQVCGEGG